MIKDGVIIDTSILINFLNGKDKDEDNVSKLIESNSAVTTGIIIAELLQGIKNLKEEHGIAGLINALPTIEMSTTLWIKAGNLSASLRKNGINLPLTDVAIATIAMEYKFSLFTNDKHFMHIPNLKLYNV